MFVLVIIFICLISDIYRKAEKAVVYIDLQKPNGNLMINYQWKEIPDQVSAYDIVETYKKEQLFEELETQIVKVEALKVFPTEATHFPRVIVTNTNF
jgi:hypothetical protein